ncbi:MAG: hypothetical protein ACRDVG_07385 [Jatrophihabitantaceae bacterium]
MHHARAVRTHGIVALCVNLGFSALLLILLFALSAAVGTTCSSFQSGC